MVLVEFNCFKYTCSRFFVLCLRSDQSEFMAVVWFLICGLIQVLFISLVVNFLFFNSLLPVTAVGLDLFSGA